MTNDFTLSSKEICAIIRSCADAQVESLTIGALKLNFFRKPLEEIKPKTEYETFVSKPYELPLFSQANAVGNELPELIEEERNLQLAIDDPSEWDRQQLEE